MKIQTRKNLIIVGGLLFIALLGIGMVSCVLIASPGVNRHSVLYSAYENLGPFLFGLVFLGAQIWLIHGYIGSFSSDNVRLVCFVGVIVLDVGAAFNVITLFMVFMNVALPGPIEFWHRFGGAAIALAMVAIVLAVTIANDPYPKSKHRRA